jgi:mono/diheme cytochrome c family protein
MLADGLHGGASRPGQRTLAHAVGRGIAALQTRSVAMLLAFVLLAASACRQDMHDQPKFIPLRESTFFADVRSARPLVEGTVARDHLRDDPLLYTGKVDGTDSTVLPFPVDSTLMARGQERFNIYCSPCHGRTGMGDGMVVRRGYRHPPSLHDPRVRDAPVGHFFDVMTNGFGAMPDYAAQVPVRDRWAIAAYIRALQFSEHATVADVPEAERGRLEKQ